MRKRLQITNRRTLLRRLLSKDFEAFVERAWMTIESEQPIAWNWHIDAILNVLDQVRRRKLRRLLVTMPPRMGKTNLMLVIFVAWCLGQDPTMNFVCVSYANDLSAKFGRLCLAIMQSGWYREVFPNTVISPKRSAADDFETTRGGGRLSTSVTGTLTGRGGDIIILDDVIKPGEAFSEAVRESVNEWYRSTLSSRLNDKRKGAIICVMQRLHQFDLAGLMLESGLWHELKLAAIATDNEKIPLTGRRFHKRRVGEVLHPQREPLEELESQRATMGTNAFNAQYQQMPVPAGGLIFKDHWLPTYDPAKLKLREEGGIILQSWDTANKAGETNAWSVCTTALYRNDLIYIIDQFRARLEMPDLVRQAVELAERYRPEHLFVEDKVSGQSLIFFLRKELPRRLWPLPCLTRRRGREASARLSRTDGCFSRLKLRGWASSKPSCSDFRTAAISTRSMRSPRCSSGCGRRMRCCGRQTTQGPSSSLSTTSRRLIGTMIAIRGTCNDLTREKKPVTHKGRVTVFYAGESGRVCAIEPPAGRWAFS